jgi:ferredoxin-NADP reductase
MSQLLKLIDRKEIAHETMAFWFDISDKNYNFIAGQHTDFTLINPPYTDDEGNTRTFSFASSPNDKERIMIATRMRPSAFKKSIREIPLGTEVEVDRPMGFFTLHEDTKRPAVFLAGGIGITPFRSMVAWATEEKLPYKIYLFYANKTQEDAAFLSDLEKFEKQNPNFKLIAIMTRQNDWPGEQGHIDGIMLKKYLTDLSAPIYYIAGPDNLVLSTYEVLLGSGVPKDNIKTEEFTGY